MSFFEARATPAVTPSKSKTERGVETGSGPSTRRAFVTARLAETAVAAWAWFGMQELAHLRLSVAGWLTALGLGAAVWTAAAAWRAWRPRLLVLSLGLEAVLLAAVLAGVSGVSTTPLSAGRIAGATGLFFVSVEGWRLWWSWRRRRGAEPVAEPARVIGVMTASLWGLLPFFSHGLLGGTDARWYAFMLHDFIDQLRAGVFPVFVGQGEFAWNGGVHPFRSAPVYMHVAGVWDWLTFHSLPAVSLQHLTVITSALVGGLGFYAAATALLPRRRWTAAGMAVLYITAPAWLGVLYCSDAYMTFMALGVLPAVLYGNARTLLTEDGRGYGWLAAGLALVWMSHPPVAMISTLVTILLQGGSFLLGKTDAARWKGAGRGALWFGGFAMYYFYSMSELPKAPGASHADALQLGGLLLTLAGLGNGWLRRRGWWWLALVPVGIGLAWWGREPWLWWLLATTVLVGLAGGLLHWWRPAELPRWAGVILFLSLLVGAAVAHRWVGADHPDRNQPSLTGMHTNAKNAPVFFLPVESNLSSDGNFQPGQGLWLMMALLAVGFVRARFVAVQLFFVAVSVVALAVVPVPWVSDFLVGFAPAELARIANLPLPIRFMPALSGFLAMGGVVWLATEKAVPSAGRGRLVAVLFVALIGWNLWQCTPFMRRGWAVTDSGARTADKFLPENRIMDRFVYDLLPAPQYLSHGLTDPWLQARLLDEDGRAVVGPDDVAREMERNGVRRINFTAETDTKSPNWIHLRPDLVVEPHERLLLRFEFDERINYSGWLIWTAEHGYREYILPDSGLGLAFGTGLRRSRVVSIVNSTDQAAHYHLTMPRGAGNSIAGNGDFFADVFVSHFEPMKASVRVGSLFPYRVVAAVEEKGWIETSRVWLPGYRATLDGQPAEIGVSKQSLAMVAVSPGRHTLELRYVGTWKLWTALVVSGLTWLGWLGMMARRVYRGDDAAAG